MFSLCVSLFAIAGWSPMALAASVDKSPSKALVIAHRGASGYLPEHSLAAKALAYGMGADYIEQDIVMSKDDALLVLHDPFLDRVTNVAEVFPGRARSDGRYYAIDFTLAEIKKLAMTEIFGKKDGKAVQRYPNRFPMGSSSFQVSTLSEELELIQGLNKSTGKNIGIYPEIKAPALHRAAGKDISVAVLKELKKYGYVNQADKVFLQCFDANELERIDRELMPGLEMNLKLVQLIAMTSWGEGMSQNALGLEIEPYNYDWMMAPGAAKKIAAYAEGIGPWFPMLLDRESGKANHMVSEAHAAGLQVHPYTFRADEGQVPKQFKSFEEFVAYFIGQVKVDGVFTDFPDRARAARDQLLPQ
ncbi:glycerophosphodiester phosphodiesterase [Pseudoteredinibacter isoporae]|nr:glycerophosphodiester phosphodiesterase [Pseudoteredinibacter isoporae]NIB24118.1 glycerophosphodiester phosphodiesterase [Pseudoteredinibacter isoporae]